MQTILCTSANLIVKFPHAGFKIILNLLIFFQMKSSAIHTCTFQTLTFDIFRSKLVWLPLGGKAQSSPYSAGQCFDTIFTISKFVFPAVFHCVFLVGFPIVFFCISTAYFIVYFYTFPIVFHCVFLAGETWQRLHSP